MTGYAIMQHRDRPPYTNIGGIRVFASVEAARKCQNGFGPIVEVEVDLHWRGRLPRGGAQFTRVDQSYAQIMSQIMGAEMGQEKDWS